MVFSPTFSQYPQTQPTSLPLFGGGHLGGWQPIAATDISVFVSKTNLICFSKTHHTGLQLGYSPGETGKKKQIQQKKLIAKLLSMPADFAVPFHNGIFNLC